MHKTKKSTKTSNKPQNLYDVARQICHEQGLPWTDPRTGITYKPKKTRK